MSIRSKVLAVSLTFLAIAAIARAEGIGGGVGGFNGIGSGGENGIAGGGNSCTAKPSAAALAAGYTQLALCNKLNSLGIVDRNNTLAPGYLFYNNVNAVTNAATDYSLTLGALTIASVPSTPAPPTTVPISGGTLLPGGTTVSGGFSAAVDMQFDPTYNAGGTGATNSWPAFWMQYPQDLPSGSGPAVAFVELDIGEWYNAAWLTTVTQWANGTTRTCTNANNSTAFSPGTGYNTYEIIVTPSSPTASGSIKWYAGPVGQTGTLLTTVNYSGNTIPSSGTCPIGAFQLADTQPFAIQLQPGTTGASGAASAKASFKNLRVFKAPTTQTYYGPGDEVPGALAFWSASRAYNSAYAAPGTNKALNVRRVSDNATSDIVVLKSGAVDITTANTFAGVDATCNGSTAGISTTIIFTGCSSTPTASDTIASTGFTQPAFLIGCGAFVAGAGTCTLNAVQNISVAELVTMQVALTITEAYDESGANSCGGSACHLTQAVSADQPQLLPNCGNSISCMNWNGSAQVLTNSTGFTRAQPYTYAHVALYNGASCGAALKFCALLVSNSAGNYAGSAFDQTVSGTLTKASISLQANGGTGDGNCGSGCTSANVLHSEILAFNATGSLIVQDGISKVVTGTVGTLGMASALTLGNDTFGDYLLGQISETTVWPGFTLTQAENLACNHSKWYGLGIC
jgi:hypothetical protein